MPQIIKIDGQAYLVNNCGCADSEFYKLTRATVDMDNGGIVTPDTGGIDWKADLKETYAAYKTCVAGLMTPYALDLAVNYQSLLAELLTGAVDLVTQLDEVLDTAMLAAAWLNGNADLADFAELATSAVAAAFEDGDYQNTMADHFENAFTGGPWTRYQLDAWASQSPQFVGAVPVRWLLKDWAQYARLDNFNNQLMLTASGCAGETGYDPSLAQQPNPDGSYNVQYAGKTYNILEVQLGYEITGAGVVPGLGEVDGVYVDWTAGSGGALGRIRATGCNWDQCSIAAGRQYMGTSLDVNMTAAIEQHTGLDFSVYGGTQGIPYDPTGVQKTTGASVTVTRVWAVNEITS